MLKAELAGLGVLEAEDIGFVQPSPGRHLFDLDGGLVEFGFLLEIGLGGGHGFAFCGLVSGTPGASDRLQALCRGG